MSSSSAIPSEYIIVDVDHLFGGVAPLNAPSNVKYELGEKLDNVYSVQLLRYALYGVRDAALALVGPPRDPYFMVSIGELSNVGQCAIDGYQTTKGFPLFIPGPDYSMVHLPEPLELNQNAGRHNISLRQMQVSVTRPGGPNTGNPLFDRLVMHLKVERASTQEISMARLMARDLEPQEQLDYAEARQQHRWERYRDQVSASGRPSS